jgi:long-chain acyl-CoA synthetase
MAETETISAAEAVSLPGLFRQRVQRSPERDGFMHFDRDTNSWVNTTWSQAAREVARWQFALQAEGLQAGDHVGLMLRNCREWAWFDQAAMGLGMVVVPLYADDRGGNVAYICDDANIKLLMIGGEEQWEKLASVRDKLNNLKRIISLEKLPAMESDELLLHADSWLPAVGGDLQTCSCKPDDLATIVYTSGTTGNPKGVMLSHRNILTNTEAAISVINIRSTDLFLSFLPLSHMLERTGGYYTPLMTGAKIAYSRSIAELAEDLQTVKPTVIISVPRIYDRVHAAIYAQLQQKSGLAQKLFQTAIDVGWQKFQHEQGRASWSPKQLLWPLMKKLVAGKVLAKLGGNMRGAMSGGAPLRPEVAHMFIGLGLPILQGYGLTETSPVISANRFEDNLPESVGKAVPGVEVRIAPDGELLTRGPHVMLGFWNRPEATAEILESDGWFHTGDLARMDRDGHIFITGRIKDILVLANGEKVSPSDMEIAIASDPLFDHIVMLGEGRSFLSAITVLNPDRWAELATELGVDAASSDSLSQPQTEQAILERINTQLTLFPGYARVRKVTASLDEFTVENRMLTPTLKVRRKAVIEHFSDQIEAIYKGH